MKFIHTADWQLGKGFATVHEKADQLRAARIDAIKQILALATKEKTDFVIAAGDIFFDNRIDSRTIEDMAALVSASVVPVYLLPGSNDPLTQDSPYSRLSKHFQDGAVVLREAQPIPVPGGTLYPCPVRSRAEKADPTSWVPKRSDSDGIRICVANGSLLGTTPAANHQPIDPSVAKQQDLDYLALGHSLEPRSINAHVWYSGAPEPTDFDHAASGKVLLVEINGAGKIPTVREVPVASYSWHQIDRELLTEADFELLQSAVTQLADVRTLLKVRVAGSLTPSQRLELESFSGERFFYFLLENESPVQLPTRTFRHPLLREMAETLGASTTASDNEEREAARYALAQLGSMVQRAGFQTEEG